MSERLRLYLLEESGERFGYIADSRFRAVEQHCFDHGLFPEEREQIECSVYPDSELVDVVFFDEAEPPSPMPVGGTVSRTKSGDIKVTATALAWAEWAGDEQLLFSTLH